MRGPFFFFNPASRDRGITCTKIFCGMFKKLLTIFVGSLMRPCFTNSLLSRILHLVPTEFRMALDGVLEARAVSSYSTVTSICWKEVPFLNISMKVGQSYHQEHWHRPIDNVQLRLKTSHFFDLSRSPLVHHEMRTSFAQMYLFHADDGQHLWKLRPQLMFRALRSNQAFNWRTLLSPISVSIIPGFPPWLRRENCLILSAASFEVFTTTVHRTSNSREQPGDNTLLPGVQDKAVLRAVFFLQWSWFQGPLTAWRPCSLSNVFALTSLLFLHHFRHFMIALEPAFHSVDHVAVLNLN